MARYISRIYRDSWDTTDEKAKVSTRSLTLELTRYYIHNIVYYEEAMLESTVIQTGVCFLVCIVQGPAAAAGDHNNALKRGVSNHEI